MAERNPRSTCIRRGLYEVEECGQLYSCQSGKPFETGTPPADLEQAGRGCALRNLQGEDTIVSLAGYCRKQLGTEQLAETLLQVGVPSLGAIIVASETDQEHPAANNACEILQLAGLIHGPP